jgi:hypothetical protein
MKTAQEMGTVWELECSKRNISLFGFCSTTGHSPRKGAPGASASTLNLEFEFRTASLMNRSLFVWDIVQKSGVRMKPVTDSSDILQHPLKMLYRMNFSNFEWMIGRVLRGWG